jgi:hypothetical protein
MQLFKEKIKKGNNSNLKASFMVENQYDYD